MKLGLFSKIKELIIGHERAVVALETRKSVLIEALDGILVENSYSYAIDDYSDFEFNPNWLRWLLSCELNNIARKINALRASLKRLKTKLHSFKRNIRTHIRQIHHFIFNSLDESDFASYLGKASIL